MRAGNLMRTPVAACLAAVLSVGCISRPTYSTAVQGSVVPDAIPMTPRVLSTGIAMDFADIVRQNGPAVVNISAPRTSHIANLTPLWPPASNEHDPFVQFFRQFSPSRSSEGTLLSGALGSGFIIRPDGYILTDAQVVADASRIIVRLADRREFKASVIGIDPPSDIALLKIDAHNLLTVKIRNPSDAKVGQWVVSVGSPYGFENTATAGTISGEGRLLPDEMYVPLIQTDLTLDTGDSGAPLFDLNGDVIGIDTPVHRTFQGLSFAIPIDVAMGIEQQLKLHGKVEHGHLGVTIQEVSAPLAGSLGMAQPIGALISSIDRNGPSAKSALRAGDVILRVNSVAITDSTQLPLVVANLRPGTAVRVKFWRDQRVHETSVVLGALRAGNSVASAKPVETTIAKFGLAVRSLTSEERKKARVTGGVRVEESTGPAALAGVQPGDIISRINNIPMSNPAQLRAELGKAGSNVALLVQRDGHPIFVAIEFG
ncbi:serine protease [Paraburkholderia ginsengiterrae]|uniref:Probable periplasmic serine endoprotease DegP-like n=1 Tax=Paraburkholderia ginsengiterrae TaxID=1462993 RepID=A0A1A9MW08_9BURK|nr:trypsin-like peptidase domain-containing protein [Paraburkholderia ginsengiterrae]OAJ51755.1 serine protease [Paraburkholderia ginsengiterrae]OAJ53320.1 serine protease [Paraburkholderia ginsengiterrae]